MKIWHGKYVGNVYPALKGQTALVRRCTNSDFVDAQFDDRSLKLPDGTDLSINWHRFYASEFRSFK